MLKRGDEMLAGTASTPSQADKNLAMPLPIDNRGTLVCISTTILGETRISSKIFFD